MNLQDDEFNRTNEHEKHSILFVYKKRRANGYLYYLKPDRLSKMLTHVLISIVESRSVEQHVIGTLKGITVLQSC